MCKLLKFVVDEKITIVFLERSFPLDVRQPISCVAQVKGSGGNIIGNNGIMRDLI